MKKKAFTIVELLIVVVIIGILATIVTLALSRYSARAKDVKVKSAIEEVQKAVQILAAEEGVFPSGCKVSGSGSVEIVSGSSSSVRCSSNRDLKITSAPKDAQGNPIKMQYIDENNYRISGESTESGKCWYVTASSKEGLETSNSSGCL